MLIYMHDYYNCSPRQYATTEEWEGIEVVLQSLLPFGGYILLPTEHTYLQHLSQTLKELVGSRFDSNVGRW